MSAVAIVVAAGSGERLGAGKPKALVPVAGRPMLEWSLDVMRAAPGIGQVVVALPSGADAASLLPPGVVGVQGGAERSHSVRAALAAAGPADTVLVHDAARPLVTLATVDAVVAATAEPDVDAAIAAAPVTDTVKEAAADGRSVGRTLDRRALWSVQTPQGFRREVLERALDQPDEVLAQATDDASLVEAAGGRVVLVHAPPENIKITTAVDLRLAELLLAGRG